MMNLSMPTIEISGVEIRSRNGKVELLVRYNDKWRLVADEYLDGPFAHAVYPAAIRNAPLDPITLDD